MANNRMYLVFRPTGDAVYLGKRMGYGWYGAPNNLAERVGRLFEVAEESGEELQDDFVIAFECGRDQPKYKEIPPGEAKRWRDRIAAAWQELRA